MKKIEHNTQDILRQLINCHGINENSLAKKTGVPQSTINRLLTGNTPDPRLSTLRPLAQHFNVTLSQLVGDESLQPKDLNPDEFTLEKQTQANTKKVSLNQKLIKAVNRDDLKKTKELIKLGADFHTLSGVDLHKYNEEHDSLLHIAVRLGHVDIVNYLLSLGVDVNAQNRRLRTPLHYAIYEANERIIQLLLVHGANPTIEDDDESTAFLWACYLNKTKTLPILLEHGSNPNNPDKFGRSPLAWACAQDSAESVSYLLANLTFSKMELTKAFNDAVEHGKLKMAEQIKDVFYESET